MDVSGDFLDVTILHSAVLKISLQIIMNIACRLDLIFVQVLSTSQNSPGLIVWTSEAAWKLVIH